MDILFNLLSTLILTMTVYAAPLDTNKDIWNVFESVIKTACSSNGQCWEWLPITETHDSTIIIPADEDSDTSRLQFRRQIASPVSELTLKSWKDGSTLQEAEREIRPFVPTNKRIPTRIMKKDVYMSRTWGAGGIPFSVLYMNPQGPRSSHAVTAVSTASQQESHTTTKSSIPSVKRPKSVNYQPSRQPTVQPRRQYLSIPHLFVLYGLGPFGK